MALTSVIAADAGIQHIALGYAGLVLAGEMPAPYTDREAARFARFALIDSDELARSSSSSHESLAARFRVPIEEILQARRELGVADGS